jgi:hypothetical protein
VSLILSLIKDCISPVKEDLIFAETCGRKLVLLDIVYLAGEISISTVA